MDQLTIASCGIIPRIKRGHFQDSFILFLCYLIYLTAAQMRDAGFPNTVDASRASMLYAVHWLAQKVLVTFAIVAKVSPELADGRLSVVKTDPWLKLQQK